MIHNVQRVMVIGVTACRRYLIAMAFMHTFLEAVHAQHTGGVYRTVPAVNRIQFWSLIKNKKSNRIDVVQNGFKKCHTKTIFG